MKNTSWSFQELQTISKKLPGKIYQFVGNSYQRLPLGRKDFVKLLLLGVFSLLAGQIFALKERVSDLETQISLVAKKTGTRMYSNRELIVREIGNVYVKIPRDWDNILVDYLSDETLGVEKHFIASSGSGFALPYTGEYAFVVGIEQRGVKEDLETFLENRAVSSDTDRLDTEYTKLNDAMFSIRRQNFGIEFFRKIDDTVLVIFVYDNGDRTVDDFEQQVVNSVGVAE